MPRSWLFLLAVLKAAGALGLLIGIGSPGFLVPTGRRTTRNGGRPAQLYRRGKATLLNPPITRYDVVAGAGDRVSSARLPRDPSGKEARDRRLWDETAANPKCLHLAVGKTPGQLAGHPCAGIGGLKRLWPGYVRRGMYAG